MEEVLTRPIKQEYLNLALCLTVESTVNYEGFLIGQKLVSVGANATTAYQQGQPRTRFSPHYKQLEQYYRQLVYNSKLPAHTRGHLKNEMRKLCETILCNVYSDIKCASKHGDLSMLKSILEDDYEYCKTLEYDYTASVCMPVIVALRNEQLECAEFLLKMSSDITKEMVSTDSEDEWEFILTHAIECSHSSLTCLAFNLASLKKWACLSYILQERFVTFFDLNMSPKPVARSYGIDLEIELDSREPDDYWGDVYDECQECELEWGYEEPQETTKIYSLLTNVVYNEELGILELLLEHDIDMNTLPTLLEVIMYYSQYKTLPSWKMMRLLVSNGYNVDEEIYQFLRCEKFFPTFPTDDHYEDRNSELEEVPEIMDMLVLARASLPSVPQENISGRDRFGIYLHIADFYAQGADTSSISHEGHECDFDRELTISSYFRQNSQKVPSLKHLSRMIVRAVCSITGRPRISKLNSVLPHNLVNYLLLPEIDDIERKYDIMSLPEVLPLELQLQKILLAASFEL